MAYLQSGEKSTSHNSSLNSVKNHQRIESRGILRYLYCMFRHGPTDWLKWVLFLNFLVTLTSALLNQRWSVSMPRVLETFLIFGLYILFRLFFHSEQKKFLILLWLMGIISLSLSVVLASHFMTQFGALPSWLKPVYYYGFEKHGRLNFLDGYIGTAVTVSIVIFILLGLLLFYRPNRSIVLIFLLAIQWISLYFTYARAAIVSTLSILFLSFLFTVQGRKKLIIPGIVVLFIVVFATFDSYFQLRLQSTLHLPQDATFQYRLFRWNKTIDFLTSMELKEWFIGIGPRHIGVYLGFKQPENQYLCELVERGVIGLISHIALLGIYFYRGIQSFLCSTPFTRALGWAMTCSISALFLHNFLATRFCGTAPYLLILMAAMATKKEISTKTLL